MDAQQLAERLASRQEWLQGRIARTQHRIAAFVDTLIKEQLLREIEGFGAVFRRRLPDEVLKVEEIGTIKRHLPGYVEAVWADFLNRQSVAVRSKLFDETRTIGRMVERDLSELLGGEVPQLQQALVDFNPTAATLRSFIMPKRGRHRAESVAKGLGMLGFIVVPFDIPLGLASLGAAHLIRKVFKGDLALADKRAITAAALSATHELEQQVRLQVEEQFEELGKNLRERVAELYAEGVARIRAFVAEGAERREELEGQRSELERLERIVLPALREALRRLSPEEALT
jgi:hypothetical protein